MHAVYRLIQVHALLALVMASAVHADIPSASELDGFFAELEQRMNSRDHDYINASIDIDVVIQTAFKGLDVEESFRDDFIRGFRSRARSGISQAMIGRMPDHARAKLISVRTAGKQGEAIYRIDFGDSGYVYLRFKAKQYITGNVMVTDWFDYSRGEYYSASLSTIIYSVAPASGLMGMISELGSNKDNERQILLELSRRMREADYAGLKTMFDNTGDEVRNNWPLLVTFVGAANLSGDDDFYRIVLSEVASRFGDDPRAAFLLIDYYYFEKRFDQVLLVLDGLFEEFGRKDAGILFLKLSAYLELEQWDKARKMAQRCIELEPDFEDAYWNLVSLDVNDENYAGVIDHLTVIAQQFGYEFGRDSFENNEFYGGFVDSVEYAEWID